MFVAVVNIREVMVEVLNSNAVTRYAVEGYEKLTARLNQPFGGWDKMEKLEGDNWIEQSWDFIKKLPGNMVSVVGNWDNAIQWLDLKAQQCADAFGRWAVYVAGNVGEALNWESLGADVKRMLVAQEKGS